MVAVALGVFLLGGGLVVLLVNPKRWQEKYDSDEEEDETADTTVKKQ